MYKKAVSFILVLFCLFVFASSVEAHPGRTAADGCHYCRTNCDSWGVPWNERHCHGGGVIADPPPIVENPPVILKETTPTTIPTKKPTPTPYKETEMDKKKMFKVTEVVDGDTIKVNVRGKIESVRLLAIDTPETKDPRKPVQCFGSEATKKMSSFVAGKFVKVVDDRSQGNRDKYSRLLRYIYLQDGTFVNSEMVKQGYAFSYKKYPTKFLEQFNKYEKEAREKNLGLWNACK
jgi:micrococcal nuclease